MSLSPHSEQARKLRPRRARLNTPPIAWKDPCSRHETARVNRYEAAGAVCAGEALICLRLARSCYPLLPASGRSPSRGAAASGDHQPDAAAATGLVIAASSCLAGWVNGLRHGVSAKYCRAKPQTDQGLAGADRSVQLHSG